VKLTDLSAKNDYLSFLLKGSWGFGKTIAAASFARLGPIHLSYFDKKGPVELVQFYKQYAPELLRNIEYDVFSSNNANEYLNLLFKLSKDCRYVCCITDSVTALTSASVNWSLGFRDNKKAKDKDKIMPDFDEYKVETSLVTQALDICMTLPCHIIWTAHPLPQMKVDGVGGSMRITKTNSIVTYGNKVAGIIPGRFSEIYQFSKRSDWDAAAGKSRSKYYVSTEQVGDDYAKSNIGLNIEMDITGKLFYDVWKEELRKFEEELNSVKEPTSAPTVSILNANTQSNILTSNPNKKPWER
jgi:hypothetical protein